METACYFLTFVMLSVKVYTGSLTIIEGSYLVLWLAYYAALEKEQQSKRVVRDEQFGKHKSGGVSVAKRKRSGDESLVDNGDNESDGAQEACSDRYDPDCGKASENANMNGFWLVVVLPACFVSSRSFQFCLQTQCLVCLPCYALKNHFWPLKDLLTRNRLRAENDSKRSNASSCRSSSSNGNSMLNGTVTLAFALATFAFMSYRFASALLDADAIETVLVNGENFSALLRYLVAFLFAASFCEQLATRFSTAVSGGESAVIAQAVCVVLLQLESTLVGRLRSLDTPFPFLTFIALVGVLLAAAFLVFDFDLARECDISRETRQRSRSKTGASSNRKSKAEKDKRKASDCDTEEEDDGPSIIRRAVHFVTSRIACCETMLIGVVVLCTCFYLSDVPIHTIIRYLFTSKRLAMISYWLFCVLFSLIVLLVAKRKLAKRAAAQKLDYREVVQTTTDGHGLTPTQGPSEQESKDQRQALQRRRSLFRKWFHIIGTAVFLPGLVVDRKYTLLASLVALFAFLVAETLRVRRAFWTTGTYIQEFIEPVLAEREMAGICGGSRSHLDGDGKASRPRAGAARVDMQKERVASESEASAGEDCENEAETESTSAAAAASRRFLVTSHVFLLAGLASSLWLDAANDTRVRSNNSPLTHIRLLSGILALGVGDALASTVGLRFGMLRWPRCRKTLDGTAAGFIGQLFVIVLVVSYTNSSALALRGVSELAFPALAVLCTCLIEAFTDQCDNLFLPLFMYAFLV